MKPFGSDVLAFCLPQENACHLCGRWIEYGILCPKCMRKLSEQRIAPAQQGLRRGDVLENCIAQWKHHSVPRELVHLLKYSGDVIAARPLAEGMMQALRSCVGNVGEIGCVLPVPLHWKREEERGYNQAALLAAEVCAGTGLPLRQDVLYRARATETLVHASREQRLRTMQGAFAVAQKQDIANHIVLLVDDVFTTGATATACGETLLQAGAKAVYLLTACRA